VTGHRHASDAPRFAIVGAGVIGAQHAAVARQLADHMELAAIVDVHVERAAKLTAVNGGSAFGSLTEALGQVDIDVVVVCTPTGQHREVAIEALEAGKHVILEKPAETTVERTDAIIEAQRRAGRLVTVISQHRFDPSTEVVLAAINAGELGRLTSGIASIDWWRGQSYYDSADWRGTWALDGGGALMNQGVHTVDLLVAAFGQPAEVFGYTAALAHQRIEVEDVAVAVVRFESGALAVLHATTSAFPGLSARLHVHGDRGSAVLANDSLAFLHKAATGTETQATLMGATGDAPNQADQYPEATANASAAGADPGQLSDAHRLQYLNFLAALRGEEELRVTLETNRRSIGVIEAVYTSARTGKPVTLS
jgi:UDP-N-acetyl-2-amino-2-deoxyglucuronate dehydrogenase